MGEVFVHLSENQSKVGYMLPNMTIHKPVCRNDPKSFHLLCFQSVILACES